jgi:hypothetical protein
MNLRRAIRSAQRAFIDYKRSVNMMTEEDYRDLREGRPRSPEGKTDCH